LESKLAIIGIADIVGYSERMDTNPQAAISMVRKLQGALLEPVIATNKAEVLKRMGDGWIISFPSVTSALMTAMEVQRQLVVEDQVRLRFGLHVGELYVASDDFYGPVVNVAQRIQVESPPGGVMISQDLYRQAPTDLVSTFSDAGSFKLKNITLPVTLYQWRPAGVSGPFADEVPTIVVEEFEHFPDAGESSVIAGDLRDQLFLRLSQRTGVRVLDNAQSRKADAAYRLQGRIRMVGKQGRFSLSLISNETGSKVWSQIYNGDTSDIFKFCDQVVDRADSELRVQINQFDGQRVQHLPDQELSISELRSRAASLFHHYTIESLEHAQRLLQRGLRLNPHDPMAKAMYADAAVAIAAAKHEALPEDLREQLLKSLNEAIEASPRGDYIFWARSYFRLHVLSDIQGARQDVQRTLSISPAYAHGFELLALVDMLDADFEAALENIQKAISLNETDPILPYRHYISAICNCCSKEFDAAIQAIDRAIQLKPSVSQYVAVRAFCEKALGLDERSEASTRQLQQMVKTPSVLALRIPLPEQHSHLMRIVKDAMG
jgi:adenylate cyclase